MNGRLLPLRSIYCSNIIITMKCLHYFLPSSTISDTIFNSVPVFSVLRPVGNRDFLPETVQELSPNASHEKIIKLHYYNGHSKLGIGGT